MKIVSKGAVLIMILMIKLTYKQSRGSTDFIHGYCEAERDDIKCLCDTLDFTENVVTESRSSLVIIKESPLLNSLDQIK